MMCALPDDIDATSQANANLADADPAKAQVMAHIHRLVVDDYAEWHALKNGDVQLRFHTGETFLLAKAVLVRIA